MKTKLLVSALFALSAFQLRADEATKPSPEIEQLKQVAAIVRQQRDLNAQALQDTQAQLQLLAAENAELKKQLAAATAAKPETPSPKPTPEKPDKIQKP